MGHGRREDKHGAGTVDGLGVGEGKGKGKIKKGRHGDLTGDTFFFVSIYVYRDS